MMLESLKTKGILWLQLLRLRDETEPSKMSSKHTSLCVHAWVPSIPDRTAVPPSQAQTASESHPSRTTSFVPLGKCAFSLVADEILLPLWCLELLWGLEKYLLPRFPFEVSPMTKTYLIVTAVGTACISSLYIRRPIRICLWCTPAYHHRHLLTSLGVR